MEEAGSAKPAVGVCLAGQELNREGFVRQPPGPSLDQSSAGGEKKSPRGSPRTGGHICVPVASLDLQNNPDVLVGMPVGVLYS